MVGIYKITSPSSKVYIGQSWEIEKRWYHYKYLLPYQRQFKLLNSFKKHGLESHSFEVVHELPKDISQKVLDDYEILYISQYKNCGIELMNCTDGGKGGRRDDETKKRVSNKLTGKKRTQEFKDRISETNKLRTFSPTWKGRKEKVKKGYGSKSEEHKKNLSISCSNGLRKGENNGKSKLTEHDVLAIRDKYDSGNYSIISLARAYGLHRSGMFSIVHRITWGHI